MLSFSDPGWSRFTANYTNGTHIAELLACAKAGSELSHGWYEELFQELCHQYTVSEAAYPAAPHLVHLAISLPDLRSDLLILLGCCHAFSIPAKLASISPEIVEEWHRSASEAIPLITGLLEQSPQDPFELLNLFIALAAVSGHPSLAQALERLDYEGE